MDFTEKTLDEMTIYQGKIIHVKELTVALPNGNSAKREVVLHPGAVAVLAEPSPNHIILVNQFRKAPDCTLWEVPAGKLEPNEQPEESARRELREETGFVAGNISLVHDFYTSPGFANEKIYVYYANELVRGEAEPDEDEFVEMKIFSRDEIERMLKNHEIHDAKTLVGLLWWSSRGERE